MNKYKVGDKVYLEGKITDDEPKALTVRVVVKADGTEYGLHLTREFIETCASKTYSDGLNDAWELVKKLNGMTFQERADIFGYSHSGIVVPDILKDFTPQQALAKIEAYEESKVIKVGDVVVLKSDDRQKFVVTYIFEDRGKVAGTRYDGMQIEFDIDAVVKTDKHLDIEHLLEQIRGNE